MKTTTVTLRDIARESGFSVTTVSQVLSGTRLNHASPHSREAIQKVAKRLNYRPNLNARQLVTRKSNIIGMLIDTRAPLFYQEAMMELERLAFHHDYRLQVGMVHESLRAIRQYVDDFLGMGVQGVICTTHNYPEFGTQVPQLFDNFRQVVFLEEPLSPTRFPVIGSAHYRNHFDAVRTMLAHGYRRIVCLRAEYHDRAYSASRQGIRDAYEAAGLPYPEEFWQGYAPENFTARLEQVMQERPEVLILDSDRIALQVLRQLAGWKMRVPEDICLFSAESSPYARDMTPSLAGFEYQPEALAGKVFARLLDQLDTPPEECSTAELIPARTFWGESCPLP